MGSLTDRTADYFDTLARLTREASVTDLAGRPMTIGAGIEAFLSRGRAAHEAGNKLIFIGNGASATMASHYALDFSKNGGIRSLALNDGAMLTALVNDVGGEAIFAEQVGYYGREGDILVAISSSGSSPNILKAVERARDKGCGVITFSGFDSDNPLRLSGDLNFHVAGDEYGFVEVAHSALIHAILDLSLGWGTPDDRNPGAMKRRRQKSP
ncbi:MAG: SIS domain-containing protein [Nisaea sp.]|uniref:SIS domain-containing protein n=1 Tax=Nisaea sp. TaxID=2024842 RepID=UPI001AFF4A45|nr:SIS domain-containing protein [Nisaea sp.]MBO6561348.1 SIS domain-containing protein [Nisaea sp.]